jgi:hypothetical protein
MLIAIQYLQPEPDLNTLSPEEVQEKQRAAGETLPITHVLVGWNIPQRLLDACREETRRMGAKLFRWQPLLTGDGVFRPLTEWHVRNMEGKPVTGYQDTEGFTFVCPNHPSVQNNIQEHLHDILREHPYDGLFLDRIRFPGLSYDPVRNLACFCEHCRYKAADQGLDLDEVKDEIMRKAQSTEGRLQFAKALFNVEQKHKSTAELTVLERFLLFRQSSITRLVQIISEQLQHAGLQVGLDCFAPTLTKMVGQDLSSLSMSADWVKVMTYARVNAPAGMPYELMGLLDWLMQSELDEKTALTELGRTAHIKMPSSREELLEKGISVDALRSEVSRGVLASGAPLLAGIELVEVPGVTQLNDAQIRADLKALLSSGPAGLALSWDLRHIPLERLKMVGEEIDRLPPVAQCCR